jgi:PPOX class probable F420-dependent enzyme
VAIDDRRTLDQLPAWALALLERRRVAHLAFADDRGRPRVLPVTFAVLHGAVWTAVDDKPKRAREPARVRYLRDRPQAALCVDHYDDDWRHLAWVQVLGSVTLLDAVDGRAALDALAARYAPYVARRPPGPLLRLEPDRVLCWRASEGEMGEVGAQPPSPSQCTRGISAASKRSTPPSPTRWSSARQRWVSAISRWTSTRMQPPRNGSR